MNLIVVLMIALSILLNATAQIALKLSVDRIGGLNFSWSNLISLVSQLAVIPWIWLGLFSYVASMLVWMYVLSKVEVSLAYPLISLGYLVTAIMAYFFLGENLTLLRLFGILVILAGVFIVARS